MTGKKVYAALFQDGSSRYFGDWPACERAVKGRSNVKFKGFPSREIAREWIDGLQGKASPSREPGISGESPSNASKDLSDSGHREDASLLHVYVDGSFMPSRKQAGYGWVAVRDDQVFAEGKGITPGPALSRNIDGELLAALEGAKWALENGYTPLIHYDYAGIACWAEGSWQAKSEIAKQYVREMGPLYERVRFRKVKGHSGDKWNDYADELAKAALLGSH